MEKLTKYLHFIKENFLEEVAKDNLQNARTMNLPLMKMVEGMSDEMLLEQGKKSIRDFAEQMADGTYIEKRNESLRKWENDELPELKNHSIEAEDLILIYPLQRKMFYNFLTRYTKDLQLALDILQELDELQTKSQVDAMRILMRKQRQTEERVKFQSYLLDNANDAILTTDMSRTITYSNKSCEKMFGFTMKELMGRNAAEAFKTIPKSEKKRSEVVNALLEKGNSDAEIIYLSKSGEPIPVLVSASEMTGPNGERAGYFVIFKDISERIKHEQQIEQTNAFLNTILENIPNMVFVKDAENLRFVRFNKAGEELLGYTKADLIGKNDYDFFPKEQADFFTAKDREVLAKGTLFDIKEEPVMTLHKGERWLHTKKLPVMDEHGKPVFLMGISEDITEQRKWESAILSLNKELEAFTYSVSHDLRAPLRAVSGYSNMLEEDFADELGTEGKRLIGVIKYNAEKMGRLIDDLLAFSRLGKKEIQKSRESMQDLVDGVLIELNKSTHHNAEIKIGKLAKAKVDYGLMHQVMLNLISNAVKYSSKVEKPVVEISSKKEGNEIVYCVKDNGVGFDMKYAGKLFGVFQRLHSMEEFEGTGVGLAIVQRVVAKHHGRVWAEGKIDKGAAFYVALPDE